MSYHIIHDGYLHGEYLDPPEYASSNPEECGKCMAFIDRDEAAYLEMADGSLRCDDCRQVCNGCGEWCSDESKTVILRCYISGKLEPWCCGCAADQVLDMLLCFQADAMRNPASAKGIRNADVDSLSRESIDALWDFYKPQERTQTDER